MCLSVLMNCYHCIKYACKPLRAASLFTSPATVVLMRNYHSSRMFLAHFKIFYLLRKRLGSFSSNGNSVTSDLLGVSAFFIICSCEQFTLRCGRMKKR